MDTLTRRRFLLASGVVGAGTLVAGGTALGWQSLVDAGARDPRPSGAGVLVLVTLYGGNDGLSTVVPYTEPAYRSARSDLAFAEDEVLPLGEGLGLNSAMTGLHELWRRKQVAIVRGIGYPKPDLSHFRSMDIWQTASPKEPVRTGWLGRWLDSQGHDPLRAVSLGPVLPPLLAGEKGAGSALPLGRLALPDEPVQAGLRQLARPHRGEPPLQAAVAMANADLVRVVGALGPAVNAVANPPDPSDGPTKATGASAGGQGELARQLAIVARCVLAEAPTRVYAVSLGGFDTHSNEKATQTRLLGELDSAVAGFLRTVGTHPAGRSVVVVAYSEFGRRVGANASEGTDHGTAGVLFAAGARVRGGFYGDQPSVRRLDRGNLEVTTDFRSVYAELLEKVLDTEPERVLSGGGKPLGFL